MVLRRSGGALEANLVGIFGPPNTPEPLAEAIKAGEKIYKAAVRPWENYQTYRITLSVYGLKQVVYWPFHSAAEVERAVDRLHLPVSSWAGWEVVKEVTVGGNPKA